MSKLGDQLGGYAPDPSGILHGFAHGGTLGLSTKAEALLAAAILRQLGGSKESFGSLYKRGLEAYPEIEKQSPGSHLLGNIGGAAAVLPWNVTSYGGAAGLGGLYGALGGLFSNTEGDVGQPTAQDIQGGIKGGTVGAILGPLGQALQTPIAKGINYLGQKGKKYIEPIGDFISNQLAERTGPSADVLKNIAQFESYNIPFKKSNITGKPGDALLEEQAQLGKFGEVPQQAHANLEDIQKKAFEASRTDLLENQIGNGQPYIEKGKSSNEAISELTDKAIAERAPIKAAYAEAYSKVEAQPKEFIEKIRNDTVETLQKAGLYPENAPEAYGQISALNNIIKEGGESIQIPRLESWRQQLNSRISAAKRGGQSEHGLVDLKRSFDKSMDDLVETALSKGDTNFLEKFKDARGLASDWAKKYQSSSPKDFGKKFVADMVERARYSKEPLTSEMIVNRIFGADKLGFGKEAPYIIRELRNHLPEAALDKIRLDAGARLLKPLSGDKPSVTKFYNNLNNFLTENHSLASELFTKVQIDELKAFGDIAHKLYGSKIKSNINPSQSEITRQLDEIVKKKFGWIDKLRNRPQVEFEQSALKKGLTEETLLPKPLNPIARGYLNAPSSNEAEDRDNLSAQ